MAKKKSFLSRYVSSVVGTEKKIIGKAGNTAANAIRWASGYNSDAEKNHERAVGQIKGYKKGGKVKKTGIAKLHKGERVLTKKQAKKYNANKMKKAINKYRGF